jgi:type II secretory pathway pseudopilin PulG
MAGKSSSSPAQAGRQPSEGVHEGFLRHNRFRWLQISTLLCIAVIAGYALIDVQPRHNGGSWYGYFLGTIGILLILWLSLLGVRKRVMSRGAWSLKAWTSAHVYLGLSLSVIGTLHTGFQFGWNVHTLAYVLMILVIVSGIWGIAVYATLPRIMSSNRDQTTETQMLAALRSIDRQLHDAAQSLEQDDAQQIQKSLQQDPFGGGLYRRLFNRYPRCATRRAWLAIRALSASPTRTGDEALDRVDSLLERKRAILSRMRRHLQLKAMLEIWLYIHVPMTFALIAALSAHIFSVFFYW